MLQIIEKHESAEISMHKPSSVYLVRSCRLENLCLRRNDVKPILGNLVGQKSSTAYLYVVLRKSLPELVLTRGSQNETLRLDPQLVPCV